MYQREVVMLTEPFVPRNITNKKYLRRQARKMQEQSRHNRESQPGQHSQNTFIPRTARMPAEASNQLPPAEFAAILTQKLEKLKREQELNEKLTKKLSEDSGSMVSQVNFWHVGFSEGERAITFYFLIQVYQV